MTILTDITAEVQQGEVIVNSVDVRVMSDNLVVFDIDCKSKYAEILATSEDGRSNYSFYLEAGERTLHTDPSHVEDLTEVKLGVPDGAWNFTVEGGRYSWTVVAYKRDDEVEYTSLYSRQ